MSDVALLTVFTPAYNRAHTLPRTYASLCAQSCKDFIWLIVDDGSSDDTAQLVRAWQREDNGFPIEYIYKENGGMHTAHNTAYAHIRTELNTCVDSDDMMPPDAVEAILRKWAQVKDLGYAGMIALDADLDGCIIGKGFPEGMTETTLSGYYANGGRGDKKLIYRTDVINSYPPYPVFDGEKYVPLSYKYLLCDQEYKLAVLPKVVCLVEYQADGSTATMWRQYKNNPNGFLVIRELDIKYASSFAKLAIAICHYISSSILSGKKHIIALSPVRGLTFLLYPVGYALSRYTLYKAERD